MLKKIASPAIVAALALAGSSFAQTFTAADNFENNNPGTAYNDGIQYGDNGGTGFGPITFLEGSGGGLFDGTLNGRALGFFAGIGSVDTQAAGRTLNTGLISGTYTLNLRFDLDNSVGSSGINLKSALGSTFGGSELLFVGLAPTNQGGGSNVLFVSDGTGSHIFNVGTLTELRGQNLNFSISFNTASASYSITATAGAQTGTFSGSLKDTNGAAAGTGAVAALGFGNFNSGSNQNVVVDDLNITGTAIPEPSSLALLAGPAMLGAWFYARRRRS